MNRRARPTEKVKQYKEKRKTSPEEKAKQSKEKRKTNMRLKKARPFPQDSRCPNCNSTNIEIKSVEKGQIKCNRCKKVNKVIISPGFPWD